MFKHQGLGETARGPGTSHFWGPFLVIFMIIFYGSEANAKISSVNFEKILGPPLCQPLSIIQRFNVGSFEETEH